MVETLQISQRVIRVLSTLIFRAWQPITIISHANLFLLGDHRMNVMDIIGFIATV
jgi:hypothetical protein